jgi:2-polyprenyl-3-methyl-5-hydroxy-6-metoxy-1,4-benzoquinol methylase
MKLPNRPRCFACTSARKEQLWASSEACLIQCVDCAAEWLEGSIEGEQAHSYSHVGDSGERYLNGRARRFGAYLKLMSRRPGHLLDVGCGTGAFMTTAGLLGWEPVGIELTEEAAAVARNQTGFRVVSGDLTHDNPFGPKSFDVVTLWGVLEHVPNPEELLRACTSLLRDGGSLLIESPNPQGLFRMVGIQLMRLSSSRFQRPFLETMGAGHIVWLTPRSIHAAAGQLKLRVVDVRGSRNSTRNLILRWAGLPQPRRSVYQAATALLNATALPSGRPNQIMASLRCVRDAALG